MTELSPGTRVLYLEDRPSLVKFAGTTHFAPGTWIGIELEDGSGKNDGSVQGQRYFDCEAGHGMFVRRDTLTIDSSPPLQNCQTGSNGIEARSRQSLVSAETARKRQSLMGSRVTPGSRPSLRSPTKSPTKMVPSYESSSGQSSPRTSTPTTTARTSNSSAKSRLSVGGRTSMGPPPPLTPKLQSRPSLGGVSAKPAKPDAISRPRTSVRQSLSKPDGPRLSLSRERSPTKSLASEELHLSPPIPEEVNGQQDGDPRLGIELPPAKLVVSPQLSPGEGYENMVPPTINGITRRENQPSATKELEQMKARYTTMERKRMEDRDRLKAAEGLRAERDKFESIIQVLQRKCQAQSQEIADFRKQLDDSEARADSIERNDAERGTEVEMATLDKEMAEERLEAAIAELEVRKDQCEELQLELEIVRDENRELSSGMTSEERSDAGWLQMEKENNRLRNALVALRDLTQETESGLKSHVKELEHDLEEHETLKSESDKTNSELKVARSAIKTLKANLEAADNQEALVSDLTDSKDALQEQLDGMSGQIKDLEKEIEDYQQIQETQDAMEKCLQDDLDDLQELAREQGQQIRGKTKVVDDLESTLVKFKEVTMGLQRDLEELRADKELNETEATELNVRSREMMDLNLRLQNSASKNQAKRIESELVRITGEDNALHVSILRDFLSDRFKKEKDPILTFLRFKRVSSKANMLRSMIDDNLNDAQLDGRENLFVLYDVREKLQWVTLCCSRCHEYMKDCPPEDFLRVENALHELDPVERSLDTMVDAARGKELDIGRWVEPLQRMIALLSDLVEKTVPLNVDTLANAASARAEMLQLYSETTGAQLILVQKLLQRLVSGSEEEMQSRIQDLQRLGERSRTCRVIAGKVLRGVNEHRSHHMTLGESSIVSFEQTEGLGKSVSTFTRLLGHTLLRKFDPETMRDAPLNSHDIQQVMQALADEWVSSQTIDNLTTGSDTVALISQVLSQYQAKLDLLSGLVSDLSNFSEFEHHTSPWLVRAKALREERIVDPEMESQLRKFQRETQEKSAAMSTQNKTIEEQKLKIEVLDARSKGLKDHASALQRLEEDLSRATALRDEIASELQTALEDKRVLEGQLSDARVRSPTEQPQNTSFASSAPQVASAGKVTTLATDLSKLQDEISNLQSAVRFLKRENHRLLHPAPAATLATSNLAWLESHPPPPPIHSAPPTPLGPAARGSHTLLQKLLHLTDTLKPVQLQAPARPDEPAADISSSWRPMHSSPRYVAAAQREEYERWVSQRKDEAREARFGMVRRKKKPPRLVTRVKDEPPLLGRRAGRGKEAVRMVVSPPP